MRCSEEASKATLLRELGETCVVTVHHSLPVTNSQQKINECNPFL